MGLQRTTRDIIETKVSRKENFNRGNVSGKWVDRKYFSSSVGMLPREFAKVLVEHSSNAELFVLYSYQTPMAWYSLPRETHDTENIGTNGTGKWYYVEVKYSPSTTNHQNAFKYALKGENVVILTSNDDGNVTETEHEFY